jgi:hypothetical protein
MSKKRSDFPFQSLLGVTFGVVLTLLYVRYGYTPPWFLQLIGKFSSIPERTVVEITLDNPESSLAEKQRAIVTRIAHDSEFYIEIDNATDNRFTTEVIKRKIKRKFLILQGYVEGLETLEEREGIREKLKNRPGGIRGVKIEMIAKQILGEPLLLQDLKEKYQTSSPKEIAEKILVSMEKDRPEK